MSPRWLLVGAMGAETLPLLRRLAHPRPLGARLLSGQLGGQPVVVLTAGVGPEKAHRRCLDALARVQPDRVLSFGTCGALVDGLDTGAVRGVQELLEGGRPLARLEPWPGVATVPLTTEARACWTRDRRMALAATGAWVVEMEAAAVWRASQQHQPGLPVQALKVVSDQAGAQAADPMADPERPDPLTLARFQARALDLVDRLLLPALIAGLGQG